MVFCVDLLFIHLFCCGFVLVLSSCQESFMVAVPSSNVTQLCNAKIMHRTVVADVTAARPQIIEFKTGEKVVVIIGNGKVRHCPHHPGAAARQRDRET